MEEITKQKLEGMKQARRQFYKELKPVRCPALENQQVHFTSDGFHHLIYDSNRSKRKKKEQYLKLCFLKYAPGVIELSSTVQELRDITEVTGKPDKNGLRRTVKVRYWGFVCVTGPKCRVRVILRRVGENGQIHFWSVMPDWKTSRVGNQIIRVLADRDLNNA